MNDGPRNIGAAPEPLPSDPCFSWSRLNPGISCSAEVTSGTPILTAGRDIAEAAVRRYSLFCWSLGVS